MTVTLERVTRAVDGIPTIRDVSLTLERGTLSVLLGPTLSGKTSIMRLLAGLDKPTTGRVLVDGKDVTGFDVRKRSVAMVYQQFINYPSLTVYENIASPLRVQGKPRAEIESRVQEAAKLLKLEPYLNRTPLQLSGGQQQRTAIARALVKGADLVLLDEPLANLDYKLREELRTELPLSSSMPPLSLPKPCCSAVAPSACGRARSCRSARPPMSIAIPTPCGSPRCFPIRRSTLSGSKSTTARCSMPAACRRRPPDFTPASATAPIGSASAPTSSKSPTESPAVTRFPPP
jgi:ABC-type lipoprotein export system ATPase subunit